MINHLGRKPVRGGRPARESRVKNSIAFNEGVFVHVVMRVVSFKALIEFRARKVAAVMRL